MLRLKKIWLDNQWIGPLLLFCVSALIFTAWISAPTFRDPDSFYHLKIAQLMMKRQGAIVDFPWLQFTTLSEAYVDHHFLYHVFLIPFLLILNPFVAMKTATVLLGASAITLFYIVLKNQRVRYSSFFTLTLLFTHAFAFRMSLSKAPSVSFLFLISGLLFIIKGQYKLLSILSFLFVWSYGGFILMIILGGTFSFVLLIEHLLKNGKKFKKNDLKTISAPFLITSIGTISGLLIHPSFPQHLKFYWQQVIQIGLLNYQGTIGVGGEWYPMEISKLLSTPLLITGIAIIGLIAFFIQFKKQTTESKVTFILSLFFLGFTLKSQRYIEYAVPWTLLWAVFSIHSAGWLELIPDLLKKWNNHWFKNSLNFVSGTLALFYFLFIIPGIWIINAQQTYKSMHKGIPYTDFADAGRWLKSHSTKGDVVFHSNWDIFPQMFYNVARVRYIVGLDPTFMYNFNPELYQKWRGITLGETSENLLDIIQNDFDARFIVIENDNTKMMENIEQEIAFKKVYTDTAYTIFRVPRKQEIKEEITEKLPQE